MHWVIGSVCRLIVAIFISYELALNAGYRKKSLSTSGALAAFVIGIGTVYCGGGFGTVILFWFFASSSFLTHSFQSIKRKREFQKHHRPNQQQTHSPTPQSTTNNQKTQPAKVETQRNAEQVIANGWFPTGICVLYRVCCVWLIMCGNYNNNNYHHHHHIVNLSSDSRFQSPTNL